VTAQDIFAVDVIGVVILSLFPLNECFSSLLLL
jgi:hypothetical protein